MNPGLSEDEPTHKLFQLSLTRHTSILLNLSFVERARLKFGAQACKQRNTGCVPVVAGDKSETIFKEMLTLEKVHYFVAAAVTSQLSLITLGINS